MIGWWNTWWSRFTKRERIMVAGGIGIIGASVLYIMVVEPQLTQLTRLERNITRHHTTLQELAHLGQEYQRLQHDLTELDARMQAGHGSFSLLPFLEEVADQVHIRDRIASVQPQPSTTLLGYEHRAAEIKLENLHLAEILEFLGRIEKTPFFVHIQRVQIKPRFDRPHRMDALVRVATYDQAP